MGAPQSHFTILQCDNQSAIQIAYNDVFHRRTKYIQIDCHFVRQHVTRNTVRLLHVSCEDQLAAVFTKVHPPDHFQDLIFKFKMVCHLSPWVWERKCVLAYIVVYTIYLPRVDFILICTYLCIVSMHSPLFFSLFIYVLPLYYFPYLHMFFSCMYGSLVPVYHYLIHIISSISRILPLLFY